MIMQGMIKDTKELTIHIIRHGKTVLNEEHRYQGSLNPGLSENGKKDLISLKNKIIYPCTNIVFVSPMKRAKETAEIIFGTASFVEIPELTEIDFGDFEGKTYEELRHVKEYLSWLDECVKLETQEKAGVNSWLQTEITNNDGSIHKEENCAVLPEAIEDYVNRVKRGIDSVIEKCNELNISEAVIVSHGGVINAVSKLMGESYYKYNVPCGEYITFKFPYEKFSD